MIDHVDRAVVEELKDALRLSLTLNKDEGGFYLEPDRELILSLKNVLKYYMPFGEYNSFMQEIVLQELVNENTLLGLYDGS